MENPAVAFRPHIDGIENDHLYFPGGIIVLKGRNFYNPEVRVRFKGRTGNTLDVSLSLYDGFAAQSWDEKLFAQFPEDLGGFLDQTAQVYVKTQVAGEKLTSNEVPVRLRARRVLKTVESDQIGVIQCSGKPVCRGQDDLFRASDNWCLTTQDPNKYSPPPEEQSKFSSMPLRAGHGRYICEEEGDPDFVTGVDQYAFPLYNDHVYSSIVHEKAFWSNWAPYAPGPGQVVYVDQPLIENNRILVSVAFHTAELFLYYGLKIVLEGSDGVPFTEPW